MYIEGHIHNNNSVVRSEMGIQILLLSDCKSGLNWFVSHPENVEMSHSITRTCHCCLHAACTHKDSI